MVKEAQRGRVLPYYEQSGQQLPGVVLVASALATGLALYSWLTLQWAPTPWFPVSCAVVGLVLAGVGARVAVLRLRSSPGTPERRRRGWRTWTALVPALSIGAIALGIVAVAAQLSSASIPNDAPADSPAGFADRVTVYVDQGGRVESSVSIQGAVERPLDTAPSDDRTCWIFMVAYAVEHPAPLALINGENMDLAMWSLSFPETWVTTTGGDVDDGQPREYEVDWADDCYLGNGWTLDSTDPHPPSEVGTMYLAASLPSAQVPATMTVRDEVGRLLHFDFDDDGCLARERSTRDPDLGGGTVEGCPYVIDRNDQVEIAEWAKSWYDYQTW